MADINSILLFTNGAVAVFDRDGHQIPEYQTNLFCDYLRGLFAKGVITGSTSITTPMGDDVVGNWISTSKATT